ncbi:MAG: HlyD family efflux transporter periplasmic adaptor subunit [Eubacterium sp.]
MKKKKIIMGLIILALILIGFGTWTCMRNSKPVTQTVKTEALTKTNVKKTVSTSGLIESTSVEQVSNSTNIPVWDVDVEVGNWVSKGDRLCRLYSEEGNKWESVYAPVAGTITAINAVNGAPAAGVLFTIENTNSLKVMAKIKEADVGVVKTSMPVIIKTDATGDKEYTGSVTRLAPTAVKAVSDKMQGSATASSQNPEFETEISLDSDVGGLLIGMKARVSIITEEKTNVYTVPYDVLVTGNNGEKSILAATDEKDGDYKVTSIPVTTGIETDFAIEIAGNQLTDNLPIITDVGKVKAGDLVRLQSAGENTNGEK